jgi:[acyl-carrier-protein] S-malonyltransferase
LRAGFIGISDRDQDTEIRTMSNAFIFPGQGSQEVGMGKALADAFPAAKAVFEEVDAALGEMLSVLMWEGPKEDLTLTQNTQPALMVHSMAVVRVLEADFGISVKDQAAYVAGHSLGEYSALAAAGTFSVGDAARLLRTRGEAMQKAVPVGEGAMAALLGVGLEAAQAVAVAAAEAGGVCQIANDNDPTQVVLSGSKEAVDRVAEIGKAHGVRRAVSLPVSAPFHCALMRPAADVMAEALEGVEVKAPVVPVIANVTASPETDPAAIKKNLIEQVTATVRWRECVIAMASAGVTDFFELGTGKVLSGLVRRIAKDANATPAGTPEDIESIANLIKA